MQRLRGKKRIHKSVQDGCLPPTTTPTPLLEMPPPDWMPGTIDLANSRVPVEETGDINVQDQGRQDGSTIARSSTNMTDPSTIPDHNKPGPGADGKQTLKAINAEVVHAEEDVKQKRKTLEGAFEKVQENMRVSKANSVSYETLIDRMSIKDIGSLSLFKDDGVANGNECGICGKAPTNPKMLPCIHSFCFDCLHNNIRSLSSRIWMKCPLCKRRISIPKEGALGFQDNTFLGTLSKKNMPCEICNEKESACRCADCAECFCFDCTKLHLNMDASKHHTIVAFMTNEDIKEEQVKEDNCSIHPENKLDLFCVTCWATAGVELQNIQDTFSMTL